MDDIERASGELDAIFLQGIVPAVVRGDRAFVQEEHARAQLVVTRIQDLAEALVARSEASIAAARADVEAVERRTKAWIVALLLGAPLLAGAVSLYIGRSIARPIARLQEGAARLAAGRLDTRIDVDSPDEFGALARQFNAMTASLTEHQDRLVQSEKLAGIGRLAAGVAHEINNPLAVILGYARLLQKRAEGPLRDELQIIEDEAVRARDIVEGLLDLSRPLPAGRARVDLREICDEVVGRLPRPRTSRAAAVGGGGRRRAGRPGQAAPGARQPGAQRRRGGRAGRRVTVRVAEAGTRSGSRWRTPARGSARPPGRASSSPSSPPRSAAPGSGSRSRGPSPAPTAATSPGRRSRAAGPASRSVFPAAPAGEAP